MAKIDFALGEWYATGSNDLSVPYPGERGQRLASRAYRVRQVIERLGIDATARADSATESVIIERTSGDDAA